MKTSYYQNPRLIAAQQAGTVAVVQTSIGSPRWGAQPEYQMQTIVPARDMLGLDDAAYAPLYVAHLEVAGVAAIRAELDALTKAAGERELVLCCFEALKKPGQFCHRRKFAAWWESKTGEAVPEF